MVDPAELWAALLSEDADSIRKAFAGLADDEARAVRDHLQRMVEDEEYGEGRQGAARAALEVIEKLGQ